MKRLTTKAVCREIKTRFSLDVGLSAGGGCWSFYAKDSNPHALDHCWTTTVMVCRLNHLSLEQWMDSFNAILHREH